jgi:predicted porin
MKKLAIALAALPAAAAVHAQSNVQFYGLVDAGVEVVNHASATGGTITRLTSGGQNTSRWGLRGSEDLGGGLKAIFQLEGGIFIDTGALDGALFRRQANVGLEGGFGRLVAGRSYTTVYDFILPFDPMGYAPAYSWATTGNGTGVSKYGMTTAFDNLLKYAKRFDNGLSVGASYGFGEVADAIGGGQKYAVAAGYTNGPLGLAATYEHVNAATATTPRDETRVYHLGASWALNKDVALKAGYRNFKLDSATGTADRRADTTWVGVNWQATPAVGLTAALYHVNVKDVPAGTDADPTMLVLRAKYALSKRTDLYAVAAHARAKNDQTVGLTRDSSADGGVTGFSNSQTGAMVGVQHRF